MRFEFISILGIIGISIGSSLATPYNMRIHCLEDMKPKKNDSIPLAEEFSAFVLADSPISKIEWEIFVNQIQNRSENFSTIIRTDFDGTKTSWYMNYSSGIATVVDSNGTANQMKMSDKNLKKENPLKISENFFKSEEKKKNQNLCLS